MKLVCIKTDKSFRTLTCQMGSSNSIDKFLPPQVGNIYELAYLSPSWEDPYTKNIRIELESTNGNAFNTESYPKDCFLTVDEYRNSKLTSIGI